MGWKVSDNKATYKHGSLELIVQTQPKLGIEARHDQWHCAWEIAPSEDSVQPETVDPAPEESYSRLEDFIVRFPQKFPWPFSYQLDVRMQPSDANLLVAELWLSVQTSMLECHPQLRMIPTTSKAPWTCHPQFICSADRQFALAIHPLDQIDSTIQSNRSGDIQRLDLFGKFMEKGVIRRGRVLLVASNSSISEKQMKELCKSFAASSLPLTA